MLSKERVAHIEQGLAEARETISPHYDDVFREVQQRISAGGSAGKADEQLATWFRRIGHDDDARKVLLAKQQQRRSTLSLVGRIWGHVLDWTVGYGYRLWLAGVWLLGLLMLGTALFSLHNPAPTGNSRHMTFNAFI